MLPFQKNKIDMGALTEEERKAFRLYGKLPKGKDLTKNKPQERKYFDSGDWVLAKEGKAKGVGTAHPKAEEIPHASPTPIGAGTSPGSSGTPVGTPGSAFPSSSSPPAGSAFSPPLSGSSGSSAVGGGIPIPGAGGSGSAGVDLAMSPGRVGVGQPLASSPTRSMHSSFSAHQQHSLSNTSPTSTSGGQKSSLSARLESEAAFSPTDASTPTGSTGNVVGKAQQRPLPGQEPNYLTSPAVAQPTSSLANPVRTDADEVEGMDLQ